MKKADIGLVGLAVMGENLVMNMESKGFTVAVYNRTTEKVERFVEGRAKGKNIVGTYSLQELADSLEKPRKVMMMVKAGQAVREGQTLIAGQERMGGGNLRACRAQGEIIARCFARGEARVRLNVTGTVETGEVRRRVILESPKSRRVVQDAEDFDRQDVSVELQPIVGLYLPVWRRVETLARTVLTPRSRSVSDARSQAQGAAEKNAKLNCPPGVEILDKWVDYSMIDDEFVYATVVLVFEAPIGARHGAD